MHSLNVLIAGNPNAPYLKAIDQLPAGVSWYATLDADELKTRAASADVLVTTMANAEVLRAAFLNAKRVRWVHSLSAGVEKVMFPELIASEVPLTNGRGAFKRSLGEWVVGAMLFFAKDTRRLLRQQAARSWEPFDVEELHGRTLGIIGYGEIGRATAERAKPFGMRIIALRRRPERSAADPLIDRLYAPDELLALIAESDYLVIAAPHTPQTHHLIGAEAIGAMKPSAVLINVGRGAVIDEASLIPALTEQRIRGAALDVFETEPLSADSPFYGLENVLLSPHSADHHEGWIELAIAVFVRNVTHFLAGEPLENLVDKHAGY